MLTREQILEAEDRPAEIVDVPEWDGTVCVRGMTPEDAIVVYAGSKPGQADQSFIAKLVAVSIVDDDMRPMFTIADVEALSKKSYAAMKRVFDAACRLNGIGEEASKELEGNSEATLESDCGTPSPDS